MNICDKPLFLPKGSVRAILALGIVGSATFGLLKGLLTPDEYLMISGVVTAFYFATKNETCSEE